MRLSEKRYLEPLSSPQSLLPDRIEGVEICKYPDFGLSSTPNEYISKQIGDYLKPRDNPQ